MRDDVRYPFELRITGDGAAHDAHVFDVPRHRRKLAQQAVRALQKLEDAAPTPAIAAQYRLALFELTNAFLAEDKRSKCGRSA